MLTPPAPIDRQAAFNLSLMLSGGVVDNDETKENEEARIAQAAEYMAFAATPIFPREDYDLEHLVSATGRLLRARGSDHIQLDVQNDGP